jgi:TatD DNase family protein
MLIDTHSHVDRYSLINEHALQSALDQIAEYGILTISNSMDVPSYKQNLEISERCDLVVPTFGVHPWNAPQYVDRLRELDEAIEHSPLIGEIGLDHYFVDSASAHADQKKVLEYFLSAAAEQKKIISLHTKGAEKEMLELLDRYDIGRVIVHWYSGPLDIFRELAARGVYFTVGIEVQHSDHIRAIAAEIPLRKLLTETDNPGGPKGFVGGPGMPMLVKDIVRGLAEARKTTGKDIVQSVQANLVELLEDDPRLANLRAVVTTAPSPAG